MKRFDLGMSINYCPTWGVVESVREFSRMHMMRRLLIQRIKCTLDMTKIPRHCALATRTADLQQIHCFLASHQKRQL